MTEQDNSIRLAKRVADMTPCSRREAEIYIEGGFVQVDGEIIEEAGARVMEEQQVVLSPDATLLEIAPVTILLHKPVGISAGIDKDGLPVFSLLGEDTRAEGARAEHFLKRHVKNLTLCTPLETQASGLVVLTQEFGVQRKLGEGL